VANWLFAQTTHVAVPKSKFASRVVSGVYYISSFIKIGLVVLPLWWSKIALPHYFGHWLIQQLVLPYKLL